MGTTRRQFLVSASALVLSAALPALPFEGAGSAFAQSVAMAELMQPGPLGEQALGDDKAPITIIEYASLTCSHCANFHTATFPKLKEKYIDSGKVRFIFREFPFDPVAAGGFMLARCAGDGKFFAMIDLLFHTQKTWAVERPLQPLFNTVKQAGFTEDKFQSCLKDQKLLEGVEAVRNRAADKFKVDSTPTFFVNGQIQKGALSIEEFDKILEPLLKS